VPHPKLKVLDGRSAGETYHLGDETLIGRDPGNHVQIRDASASRHHARIELRDTHALVKDLGSNNGTYVNGARIQGETLLESGDRLRIGRVTLQFLWHDPISDAGAATASLEPVLMSDRSADGSGTEWLKVVRPTEILPPEQAFQRLKRLYDISQKLAEEPEAPKLSRRILETALAELDADIAALIYFPAPGTEEVLVQGRGHQTARVPRSLLDQAVREAAALRFDAAASADPQKPSVVTQKIVSALVAPFRAGSTILGALYADRRDERRAFTEVDLEFLSVLASQSAIQLSNALRLERSRQRARTLEREIPGFGPVIGKSPRFLEALGIARKAAESDSPVLITGETGTGKEAVARMIHRDSGRRDGPFVALNCAALVETLLESELFGHEKGAFTGAARTKQGCFELAGGGTLFLDEIGEMSAAVQAKLLRAIQEKSFYRVGGTRAVTVDVRILAATNRDLKAAVEQKTFREDLFYRIGVIETHLPPLRERVDDIPLLAYHFLERFAHQLKKPLQSIRPEAMKQLEDYPWPGNIRELQNVLERAVVLADVPEIGPEHLPIELRGAPPSARTEFPVSLRDAEKFCIQRALQITKGKKGEAAKLLGISWPTLNKKIADYGIES
jgi:Nif-specific regulatory protein